MESLIISIISKYLKDFVNNFRPEHINVNFLGGQGVMRNLDLNVHHINEAFLQPSMPALAFTRILINKLSIEAPSLLSIKSKAIVFFIDELFVEVSEVEEVPHKPKIIVDPSAKRGGAKYGFLDRVVDSISFQINKINLAFRSLGKAKTTQVGDWTPPVLLFEMLGSRIFCTNHNNVECDLEDCFRIRPTKRPMLFVYKKLDVKSITIHLINPHNWIALSDMLIANGKSSLSSISSRLTPGGGRDYVSHTIVRSTPLEVQICMRKRLDNNRLLGLEISFVFDKLHFSLRQNIFVEFLHFIMGLSYALWRSDAVKEIYGPDPHNEFSGSGAQGGTGVGVMSSTSKPNPGKLTRDFFGEAELAQLNSLEAELEAQTPDLLDAGEWQRSTLNSDEDPPHLRQVLVIQANEIKFSFPLDNIKRPPFPSVFDTSSGLKDQLGSSSQGVTVTIKSVVHCSIWPEHAGMTESVLQTVIHNITVSEYRGLQVKSLLHIHEGLDSNDQRIDVAILPRGVKEMNYFDPEVLPGACFVYKKESSWPPPPMNGRIGATVEYLISVVNLNVDIDAWGVFISFMIGAWEKRWTLGKWDGLDPTTPVDWIVEYGTYETTLNCRGVKAILYPRTAATGVESVPNGPILPSELIFSCDDFQLVNRAGLKLRFLETLFEGIEGDGMDSFPSCSYDILSSLRKEYGLDGSKIVNKEKLKLISLRTQISFSNVSLAVSTDYFSSKTSLSRESDFGQYTPPTKALVRPFAITYFRSIDPNPSVPQHMPPIEVMRDPYRVKDLIVECSMLDIVRVIHTYDVMCAKILQSDLIAWLHPRKQNTDGTITSVILNQPAKVYVSKVLNFEVKVVASVQAADMLKGERAQVPLVALHTRNLQVSYEQPATNDESAYISTDSRPDPVVVVKAVLCGLALTVRGTPLILLSSRGGNSGTDSRAQIASQLSLSGESLLQFLDGPTATMRYEFRPGQLHSVFQYRTGHPTKFSPPPTKFSPQPTKFQRAAASEIENKVLVSVKSSPDAGVLRVELTRGTRMLTVPKLIEIAAEQVALEMLRGFGSVRSQPMTWWEDSVYGYVVKRFGLEKSSLFSIFLQESISFENSQLTDQEKERISSLAFRITSKHAFDIVILEANQVQDGSHGLLSIAKTDSPNPTYLNINFIGIDIIGKSLPGPPRSSQIKLSGTVQLVLTKEELGKIGLASKSRDICNPFTLVTEILKTGEDSFNVKSNISLSDIAMDLPRDMASDALSILDNALATMQGVSRVMVKFKSIVVDCCPSLALETGEVSQSSVKAVSAKTSLQNTHEKKATLAVALDIARMMSSASVTSSTTQWFEDVSSFLDVDSPQRHVDRHMEQFNAQRVLIDKLQENLASSYSLLKLALKSIGENYSDLTGGLTTVEEVCEEQSDFLDKVRAAAVISTCQIPTYCGWIRRSSNFSKIEPGKSVRKFNKTTGNMTWWAALIGNHLYFMQQPYQSLAEVDINMDEISVVDPDDEKIAGKVVLSTCLWICDEEGALVMNADTLNEKQMWLRALSPWLSISPNVTSSGNKPRKVFLPATAAVDLMSKGLASIGLSASDSRNGGGRESPAGREQQAYSNGEPKKSGSNLFRSATKGMMKVLGVSSPAQTSTSSPANTIVTTSASKPAVTVSAQSGAPSSSRSAMPSAVAGEDDEAEDAIIIQPSPFLDEAVRLQRERKVESNNWPSSSLSELLPELDNLRLPLRKASRRVKAVESTVGKALMSSTSLLHSAQEAIGKVAIGLAAVKVLSEELHNDKGALELRCEEAIKSARADLWAEKQNSVNLRENWSRAKGLQEQLESILEFSADQNNAQIKVLNKRYADLSSQHEKTIASLASSSTYEQYGSATNPKHFQELVKQLTINIGETERELKECQERELMAAEEQLSMKIEHSRAYAELAQIKLLLAKQKADHAYQIASIKLEIEKEKIATSEARTETVIFQKRLNSLCQAIQSLGLDITNQAISSETQLKATFVRLEITPTDPGIDLVMLWSEIKDNYIVEGVKWDDEYAIQEIELGVNILRMSFTVDESIVAIETVSNGIESLDDWVKSVRVMKSSSP